MAVFISLDVSGVVSVWLETLLYGMYTSLFIETVYVILKKNKTKTGPSKVFFYSIIVMWVTSTIHIALNLFRLLRGYVYLVGEVPPAIYFGDLGRWENIAHDVLNAVVTWIGDLLVIYRCYIVWNNDIRIVILPILLIILSVIANSIAFQEFANLGVAPIFSPSLVHWMDIIYSTAFVQNTFTTGLIAYRIWRQGRGSSGHTSSSPTLFPLIRIIVESASLYVLNVLILIILYAVNSNGQFIAQECIVPVCGIVFTLMTVRLAMRSSPVLMTTQHAATAIKFGTFSGITTSNGNHTTTTTDQSTFAPTLDSDKENVHIGNQAFIGSERGSVGEADDSGSEAKYDVPLEDMVGDSRDEVKVNNEPATTV